MTDHDPRSRTRITKLQGKAYSRGDQHLNYLISNEQWMMGEYIEISESGSSSKWNFRSDIDPTVDARWKTQKIDHDLSWVCTV